MTNQEIVQALSMEQKVKLLTGNGLWRTAVIDEFGIKDIVMTDGTYGVRYATAQIDQGANWTISDFLSVVGQNAQEATNKAGEDNAEGAGGSEALFSKSKPATCFPNGSALACSWDLALVEKMGAALGRECQNFGVGLLLGPGINLRRTPLAGRGYEYYSEDPLLTGKIAAALIKGIQSEGVGTSLKHFACNNSEYKRTEMNSIIDKRALMELYLRGFEIAIAEAKPWTVMSSYNKLNGVQTSQSYELLTTILRDKFHFDGLVMSDWYGIKDRVASLIAGNDLAMPETKRDYSELLAALKDGTIDSSLVDQSCERMLRLLDLVHAGARPGFKADFTAHHALAEEIAMKSMVLLKNDKVGTTKLLPLTQETCKQLGGNKIAILGQSATEPVIQGSGCATTIPYLLDRPLDELMALGADIFDLSYAPGRGSNEDFAAAVALAQQSNVAIIFAATVIGEDGENGDRANLDLDPADRALIEAVAKVQPHTIVVVANADSIIMPWLDQVPACVETFFAGQGMGAAIARVLLGHYNPSGKLTVTVPNCIEETPAFLNYPGDLLDHRYNEGIFVGYRYYDKRKMTPAFEFGYGLSYTDFAYRDLSLNQSSFSVDHQGKDEHGEEQVLTATFTVDNVGAYDGAEIAQLYVAFPQNSILQHEPLALKGFAKHEITKGQSKCYTIEVKLNDLKVFHPELDDFIIEPGSYTLYIGKSSRQLELYTSFEIKTPKVKTNVYPDNSLTALCANDEALDKVARFIAAQNGSEVEFIKSKLRELAPTMFCGMFITLTEFLGVEISRKELAELLS